MAKKSATPKATKNSKAPKKTKKELAIEMQNELFAKLQEKHSSAKSRPYRMSETYTLDSLIEHPKFGPGFVVQSLPDRIEVAFADANRLLVQNRK